MIPDSDAPSTRVGPALTLLLAGVFAIALVGFFVGIGSPTPSTRGWDPSSSTVRTSGGPAPEGILPSISYSEIREQSIGANRNFSAAPVSFRAPLPLIAKQPIVTREDKHVALAERAAGRAFNGAPPIIPHAVDAISSTACLGCHAQGAEIGGKVARPIPHQAYANCLQCHVSELDQFGKSPPFAESTFEGLAAPFEGKRAWPGAPPVIPHSTQMRETCLGCHGPLGRVGLRTSHPWRQSCTQCHAPSSVLDHPSAASTKANFPARAGGSPKGSPKEGGSSSDGR